MSLVTGTSAVTGIPHPHPPGVMSISASLFPAPHPELTNVVTPSCEHLHMFFINAGTDLLVIASLSQGEESEAFWCQVECADHRGSPEFFFLTPEIFIKSSQIFWVYHFGYILDRSKLKTVICNQNHTFSREI